MPSEQPKIAHIFNVLAPWATQDLITLADLKTMLRIDAADTTKDEALNLMIDGVSATIATMAMRSFGFDEVQEGFYNCVDEDRLYFSQWPVKFADIESLEYNGVDILSDYNSGWVLEENKGFMFRPFDPWNGTVLAHYKGGYKLPDEAPADLVQAAQAALREQYILYVRGTVLSGVRMIAHKQARVQYYPPGQTGASMASSALGSGGSPATWNAVWQIVSKYVRWWV